MVVLSLNTSFEIDQVQLVENQWMANVKFGVVGIDCYYRTGWSPMYPATLESKQASMHASYYASKWAWE